MHRSAVFRVFQQRDQCIDAAQLSHEDSMSKFNLGCHVTWSFQLLDESKIDLNHTRAFWKAKGVLGFG